jgi:hypothetical protein
MYWFLISFNTDKLEAGNYAAGDRGLIPFHIFNEQFLILKVCSAVVTQPAFTIYAQCRRVRRDGSAACHSRCFFFVLTGDFTTPVSLEVLQPARNTPRIFPWTILDSVSTVYNAQQTQKKQKTMLIGKLRCYQKFRGEPGITFGSCTEE